MTSKTAAALLLAVLPLTAAADASPLTVHKVDFHRTAHGGRVTVDVSRAGFTVHVARSGGVLSASFDNAKAAAELVRRLDLADFATPARSIAVEENVGKVHVRVATNGTAGYRHRRDGARFILDIAENITVQTERAAQSDAVKKISLRLQGAPLSLVLEQFAELTGLNFVAAAGVDASLTLSLSGVPWEQALDLVLRAASLAHRREGDVVWVAPAADLAAAEQRRLSSAHSRRELAPLVSELVAVHYARAADLAALLKSVRAVDSGVRAQPFGSISIGEVRTESNSLLSARGSVSVDQRTNSLLIQDTAQKIREVKKLLAQLDRPVPQVLIETRIVEAGGDFSRNLGARLGVHAVNRDAGPGRSGAAISGSAESAAGAHGLPADSPLGGAGDALSVDLGAGALRSTDAASAAFSILRIGRHLSHLISLEISALQAEGRGQVIASPKLVTADQQQAHIEQGQERVFTTSGGGSLLGENRVVTKKAVLGLTVTPHITPDERLILDVFITQDTFSDTVADTLNTKQINTQVLLNNGETVIIGGIYQKEQRDRTYKVPFLGDLPVLGRLFRKSEHYDARSELLIFLTPKILETPPPATPPAKPMPPMSRAAL